MTNLDTVQQLAADLTTPGLDIRLQLYLIRQAAWEAMRDIDRATLAGRPLKLYDPPPFGIDDL